MFRRLSARSAVLAIVVAGAAVLVTQSPAAACKGTPLDTGQAAAAADAVFTGTIRETRVPDPGKQGRIKEPVTYIVDVDRVYLSHAMVTDVARVQSSFYTKACGLGDLEPGTDYAFFVNARSSGFKADGLDGSGPATQQRIAEIETVLGQGEPRNVERTQPVLELTPVEASEPSPISKMVAPGGALVLVGLLGLALLALTRHRRV